MIHPYGGFDTVPGEQWPVRQPVRPVHRPAVVRRLHLHLVHPVHRAPVRFRPRPQRTPRVVTRSGAPSVGNVIEHALITEGVKDTLGMVPVVGAGLQLLTPFIAPVVTDVVDAVGSFLGDAFGSSPPPPPLLVRGAINPLTPNLTGSYAALNVLQSIRASGLTAPDRERL